VLAVICVKFGRDWKNLSNVSFFSLITFPKVTKLEIELRNFDTDDIITKLFPNVRDLSLQCDE
jgi:hypothetical protein